MKVTTPDLVKFKKLQRRLSEPMRSVVGILELLWRATALQAPRGDIGKFDNEDIAVLCDWDGDPDLLIDALVSSGWLDRCELHRLVVHDWSEHAPTFVRGVLSKKKLTFIGKPVTSQSTIDASEVTEQSTKDASIDATKDASYEQVQPTIEACSSQEQVTTMSCLAMPCDALPCEEGVLGQEESRIPRGVKVPDAVRKNKRFFELIETWAKYQWSLRGSINDIQFQSHVDKMYAKGLEASEAAVLRSIDLRWSAPDWVGGQDWKRRDGPEKKSKLEETQAFYDRDVKVYR